jgi:hypothetical protein
MCAEGREIVSEAVSRASGAERTFTEVCWVDERPRLRGDEYETLILVGVVRLSTALYASPSGPEDAYQKVKHYGQIGRKDLGILELTALPTLEEGHWMPFDESSDSGFAERLMGLLEDRVYFGIGAGSAIATPAQNYGPEGLEREGVYYSEYGEAAPRNAVSAWGMSLVGFAFRLHLNADYLPMANMRRSGR